MSQAVLNAVLTHRTNYRRRIMRLVAEVIAMYGEKVFKKCLLKQVKVGRGRTWIPICVWERMTFQRNDEWRSFFGGFTPRMIWDLARSLPFIDYRKHKLSQLNRTALFLFRMKTGAGFGPTAVEFGISRATAARTFHHVLQLLLLTFSCVISLCSPTEVAWIKAKLREMGAFAPDTIYVIDGTHTPVPFDEGRSTTLQLSAMLTSHLSN